MSGKARMKSAATSPRVLSAPKMEAWFCDPIFCGLKNDTCMTWY